MKYTIQQQKALAIAFSETLHRWLGAGTMYRVINANQAMNYDKSLCASHEYCDANAAMLEAIAEVLGISDEDYDASDDALRDLTDDAWQMAKENDFDICDIEDEDDIDPDPNNNPDGTRRVRLMH